MVDIEKEYDSITPMESLIDEAKKKEQAIHGDLADAITEWAVGAVAGAEEVGRAAANMGANLSPEQVQERLVTGYADESQMATPELESLDWYNKAVEVVQEETVQPAVTTAALLGSNVAAAAMLPFIINKFIKTSQGEGVGHAALTTAKDLLPIIGSVEQMRDKDFQSYAEQHPLRAASLIIGSEADFIVPALMAGKRIVKKTLLDKGKNDIDATAMVDNEFKDVDKAAVKPPKNSKTIEAEDAYIDSKMEAEDMAFTAQGSKPKRPETTAEKVDPTIKPEVKDVLDDLAAKADMEDARLRGITEPFVGAYDKPFKAVPSTLTSRVSIKNITDAMKKLVPTYQGYVPGGKQVLGVLKNAAGVVRYRNHLDLYVLAHELGHYLDFNVLKIRGFNKELIAGARSVWKNGEYDRATPELTDFTYRGEGIAQFTMEYILNPELAKENFPKYYESFVRNLEKHPDVKKEVDNIANLMRRWYTQTAEERVRGNINMYGDVEKPSLKEQLSNYTDEVISGVVDDTHYMQKAEKEIENKVGVKLQTEKKPSDMLKALKSTVSACVTALAGESGLENKYIFPALDKMWNVHLKQVTLRDIFKPIREMAEKGIGADYVKKYNYDSLYDAFVTFLASVHDLEYINELNSREINKQNIRLLQLDARLVKYQKAFDKTNKEISKRMGKVITKIMRLNNTDYDIVMGRLEKKIEGARDRFISTLADNPTEVKQVNELFRRLLDNLEEEGNIIMGNIAALGQIDVLGDLEGAAKDVQKKRTSELNKARKRNWREQYGLKKEQSKFAVDSSVENQKRRAKTIDDINKEMDRLEREVEQTLTTMFNRERKKHFNDLQQILGEHVREQRTLINRYAKNRAKIEEHKGVVKGKIDAIKNGLDDAKAFAIKQDALTVISNAPKEFLKAATLLKDYNSNILTLAEKFGFITKEAKETYKNKYPYYVPFNRSFIEEGTEVTFGTGSTGQVINQPSLFRSIIDTGSDRALDDVVIQMNKNLQRLIEKGEKNRVAKALVDAIPVKKKNKGGGFIEAVPEAEVSSAKKHIFYVWRDGVREFYAAHDPNIIKAVMNMDKKSAALTATPIGAMCKRAADTLRYGATSTLMYTLWNGIKDSFTAAVKTESGNTLPIWNTFQGLMLRADKQLYADFYAQGVPFSTRLGSDKSINNRMVNEMAYDPSMKYKIEKWSKTNPVGKLITKLLSINRAVEEAPRLYEFYRARNKHTVTSKDGKTRTVYDNSIHEAGRRARDITTNFALTGSSQLFKESMAMIPFFNATLQGQASLLRAFNRDRTTFAARTAAYIVAPTIALWAYNRNQDWYRELPTYERMNHWFIRVGNSLLRIPKPEFLGYMAGGCVEAMLNYYADNDTEALEGMGVLDIAKAATPSGFPTAALPILEWATNYSFFKGRNIVSVWDLDKAPELQYNVYTSEVAKGLGKIFGASPLKIDNTIKDVTGSMGAFALGTVDYFAKQNQTPTKYWDEYFRFTRSISPSNTNRTSDVFYKGWADLKVAASRNPKVKETTKYKGMADVYKEIGELRGDISDILKNPKKNGDVKRKEIDAINAKINSKMRHANRTYLGYKAIKAVE